MIESFDGHKLSLKLIYYFNTFFRLMRRPILIKPMIILSCCMRACLRRLEAPLWSSIWPVTLIIWRSSYIIVTLFCYYSATNCHKHILTAGISVVLSGPLAIYVWFCQIIHLFLTSLMFFRDSARSSYAGPERGLETQCGASNHYHLRLLLLLKVHHICTVYFLS